MSGLRVAVAVHARRRLIGEAVAGYLAGRPEFTVVGHTVQWPDLIALCQLEPPDAVAIDIDDMPGAGAAAAIEWLRRFTSQFPTVRVAAMYDRLSPAHLAAAADAGVAALIPYARGVSSLVHPLRQPAPTIGGGDHLGGRLSEREREILVLMSSGHSVAEMARSLGLSPRTVESHKRRIYTKLDASSQTRAVARAAALGVLDHRGPGPRRPAQPLPATHVAVCGPAGCLVNDVLEALARAPAVLVAEHTAGADMWAALPLWRGRRSVTVLAAPAPLDWRFAALIDAPLVLIPAAGTPDVALTGAAAVVPADQVARDVAAVVSVVASGYHVLDPTRRASWAPPELSQRERDILRSAALGETVRQTARSLGIATKTVENLQSRLYRKLGVRNRAAALAVAYDLGLVDLTGLAG